MNNKIKLLSLIACLCVAVIVPADSADAAQADESVAAQHVVKDYLLARIQTMQLEASAADIDRALAFCTDDVVYEHPAFKAKNEGKEKLKQGMSGFLGATKNAKLKINQILNNKDVVVADVEMTFLVKQKDGSWQPGSRKNISVFELEDGKIKRMLDY
jgi:hypothetical protein